LGVPDEEERVAVAQRLEVIVHLVPRLRQPLQRALKAYDRRSIFFLKKGH
jgi:hypothetical protein